MENEKSIDNPLIEFKISSESNGSYEIIKLREDLDVDHDELDAILKECVLKNNRGSPERRGFVCDQS